MSASYRPRRAKRDSREGQAAHAGQIVRKLREADRRLGEGQVRGPGLPVQGISAHLRYSLHDPRHLRGSVTWIGGTVQAADRLGGQEKAASQLVDGRPERQVGPGISTAAGDHGAVDGLRGGP